MSQAPTFIMGTVRATPRGQATTLAATLIVLGLTSLPSPPAQSAPARPEPTKTVQLTATTVITLDDSVAARWQALGLRLAPRPPADTDGTDLAWPATKVTESAIHHRGAIVLVGPTGAKVQLTDPIVRRGESASIDVTTPVGKLDLLRTESVLTQDQPVRKTVKGNVTTTIRSTTLSGAVRLTRDAPTILTLNGALGAYAFVAGEVLGSIETTITETTTVTKPRPAPRAVRANDPAVTYQVKTKDPVVFITIDDGIITPKEALDYVEKHSIPITSFLTSSQVTDAKARYFERISRWGSIQNHTTTHASLDTSDGSLIHRQVCPVQTSFRDRFGTKPWMMRPPYGAGPRGSTLHSVVAKCGITDIVMWDAVVEGGRMTTWNGGRLIPGSIILLHYTGNLAWDLKVAVSAARAQGFHPADLADYLTAPVKRA